MQPLVLIGKFSNVQSVYIITEGQSTKADEGSQYKGPKYGPMNLYAKYKRHDDKDQCSLN